MPNGIGRVYAKSKQWRRDKAHSAVLRALDAIREASSLSDGELWSRVHDIESRIHHAFVRSKLLSEMDKLRSTRGKKS